MWVCYKYTYHTERILLNSWQYFHVHCSVSMRVCVGWYGSWYEKTQFMCTEEHRHKPQKPLPSSNNFANFVSLQLKAYLQFRGIFPFISLPSVLTTKYCLTFSSDELCSPLSLPIQKNTGKKCKILAFYGINRLFYETTLLLDQNKPLQTVV